MKIQPEYYVLEFTEYLNSINNIRKYFIVLDDIIYCDFFLINEKELCKRFINRESISKFVNKVTSLGIEVEIDHINLICYIPIQYFEIKK